MGLKIRQNGNDGFSAAVSSDPKKCIWGCASERRKQNIKLELVHPGHRVETNVEGMLCPTCKRSTIGLLDLYMFQISSLYYLFNQGVHEGEALRIYRDALHLIDENLHQLLKLSSRELSKAIRGETELSPAQWEKIIDLLGDHITSIAKQTKPLKINFIKL